MCEVNYHGPMVVVGWVLVSLYNMNCCETYDISASGEYLSWCDGSDDLPF